MSKKHNIPLHSWVPHWMGVVITFAILIPVMMLNGTYSGASMDVSGALGVLTEDISMAYYAASAGMAVAYPIAAKIRAIVTTKTIVLTDLILQTFLAFICARTTHIEILTVCSFFMGFLRAFVIIEMIVILKPIFSKRDRRSEFYAFFYPIVYGVGQISMTITAALAYHYNWQYMYYLIIGMLVIAIILVLICYRFGRMPIHIPFHDVDWISVTSITSFLLIALYVGIYGKTKDWFDSSRILIGMLALPFILWFFVQRQLKSKTPYLDVRILAHHKNLIAYFFMGLAMFFSASSSLISQYLTIVLRIDSVHTNELSFWMIPGFIIAAAVCYWWFNAQIWKFRVLIFWGMACFTAFFLLIYFGLTPNGTYEFLYLPSILRGMGMMIILIAFGVYAAEDLHPKLMLVNAFFMIAMRSVLAPALGSSLFSNLLYRFQTQNQMILGEGLNIQNPQATSLYTKSLNSALSLGHSLTEAQQLATQALYNSVQVQALMVSIKQIIGYLLVVSIVVMVIARFTPFHKTLKTAVPKTGDDMV